VFFPDIISLKVEARSNTIKKAHLPFYQTNNITAANIF